MKKIYLITLCVMMLNIIILPAANPRKLPVKISGVGCIFSDNFNGSNDTTSLQARGYKTYYRGGGPQGTTATWFQGNPQTFNSYNGPDSGYVASNFNSVTGANTIDNWLVLPSVNVKLNDVVSFYSRSPEASMFPDSLHVWYSSAGDSIPEATTWVLLGEFVVTVGSTWEFKSFPIPEASANGRIAIRYGIVDGGPAGANSNFIGIDELGVFTPSVNDGNLLAITSPSSGCLLSSTETVTINIKNSGTDSIYDFDVVYNIDAGPQVTETIPDTITPGNSLTYSFTTLADFSVAGPHTLNASIVVPSDSNLCNDDNSLIVTNFAPVNPLTSPYKMGFEFNEDFSNWDYEDLNVDGVFWQPIDLYPNSGATCIRKAGSASSDDDWLFSGCLEMTAGSNYTLDYWYYVFDPNTGCNIESFIGTAQSHTQMTQLIIQDPLPIDTLYHHSISTFTVPSSGTYYLGFHAYSAGGTSSIRLDDINLDDGTFIGIKETPVAKNVRVFPNPTTGMFYLNTPLSSKNIFVDVYNISGQKIYSSQYNSLNQQRIDLSNQSNGIYTIRITTDSYVENHSIVVNK